MPLGIISQDEFESELSNCNSDDSAIPASTIPRTSNPTVIPNDSDSNYNPEVIDGIVSGPQSEARGRGESNTQVPSGIRKIIGETSVVNGRSDAVELASMFGISPSSVSAYKQGAHSTSTINNPNSDTKLHIDSARLRVTNRARKKLNLALSYITEDKLSEAKVGEIASVAKAMAGVIKDMEPDSSNDDKKSQQPFIVFAPMIKNENSFEVIHAKDDY